MIYISVMSKPTAPHSCSHVKVKSNMQRIPKKKNPINPHHHIVVFFLRRAARPSAPISFASTCCPTAGTSGIPLSLAITSLGSLAPALPLGPWHFSGRYAPHPCLWSYPRDSLLRGICNASALGFLVFEIVWLEVALFAREAGKRAEWEPRSRKAMRPLLGSGQTVKGRTQRLEHQQRDNKTVVTKGKKMYSRHWALPSTKR